MLILPLFFTALPFIAALPSQHATGHDTNAKRLARGLTPLQPRRLYEASVAGSESILAVALLSAL